LVLSEIIANAETPNVFNPVKIGTEALVAGVEGCQSGFEKGRRSGGRWTGSKNDKLLSFYFCACQFDSKKKYPTQDINSHAQACIDDASIKVNKSNNGTQFRVNNIFENNEYATAAVVGAFYKCEDKESKSSVHKWPKKFGQKSLYCSCLMDYFQDENNLDLTKYTESDVSVSPTVEKKCVDFAKTRK
jgi:hypothetical protein